MLKKFFAIPKDKDKIPHQELLYYSAGIAGQNMAYGLLSGWLFYYCTDVLYMSALWVGIVVGFCRIFDALNDPIMGILIDKRRFKSGEKFRPFLIITAVPIGLSLLLLFTNWGFKSEGLTVAYIFIFYFIFDILYTVQDLSMWGMTAVLSPHSSERSKAAQWGRIGAMVGSWLPGLISVGLSLSEKIGLEQSKYFLILGCVLGLGGMSLSLLTSRTKERVRSKVISTNFLHNFKMLLKNRILMMILIANILCAFSLTVPEIYFFKYKVSLEIFGLKLDGYAVSFCYGIIAGLPGSLAMFIAIPIAKKVGGMKNIMVLSSIVIIVMRFIAYLVGYEGINIIFVALIIGVSSILSGLRGISQTSLCGDSVDYMEWKTGERNDGVAFSIINLTAKAGNGIGLLIAGITLSLLDFDASLYEQSLPQSDTFNKLIWPIFILGPIIGNVLYMIPPLFVHYPDHRKKQIELELIEMRAAKKANEEGVEPLSEDGETA